MDRDSGEPGPGGFRQIQDVKMRGGLSRQEAASFWISFCCWCSLVVFLSLKSSFGGLSAPPGVDKVFHFFFYMPFAVFSYKHPRKKLANRVLVAIFAVNLGFMLELLQRRVAGRGFSWGDFLADTLGVAFGLMAFGSWFRIKRGLALPRSGSARRNF